MKRTSRRMKLCAAALLLELLFIWGNSALPGEISDSLSHWVGTVLSLFLPGGSGGEGGNHLLRKMAHFSEFACLGATLCWLFGMLGQRKYTLTSLSLLGGLTAACVDETIQIFSAGRSSSLVDVWIDTAGVMAGIGLLLLGHTFIQHRERNNSKHRRNSS